MHINACRNNKKTDYEDRLTINVITIFEKFTFYNYKTRLPMSRRELFYFPFHIFFIYFQVEGLSMR